MARNETVLLGLNQLTDWGILTTDASLNITGWNHWLEVNGKRPAREIVGRNLLEAFPDLVARRLDQFFHQAQNGQMVVLSQPLHKYLLPMPPSVEGTNLSHMQQSVRIAPLVEDGAIVGTLTVIEDVTERVAYDAELTARARQQAAVALLGQHALAGNDLTEFMNEVAVMAAETLGLEFCAILELMPDNQPMLLRAGMGWNAECVGRTTVETVPGSHVGHTLAAARPVLIKDLDSEARFSVPALLKEHDVVNGMSVPIRSGARALGMVGVYTRHLCTFTDDNIHFLQSSANVLGMAMERKRLEGELLARVEQLADTDKRKDEFLAMLAHELRNPLAPTRNALHLIRLRGRERRKVVGEAYDIMERQIEYLVRLVDDLLDVSRITREKIQLQTKHIDLATVVARAIEGSRPLIDMRRHTLEVVLPAAPLPVEADPLRLAQILWNLLNNAAKYTPEGGRIVLTVKREPGPEGRDEAVMRVRDTGVGIPAEMLPKVFDLFTQMERTLARSEGGLGIGLTLVRRLTELHGGTVQAFSKGTGQGSEFVVHLPALPTGSLADPPEKPAHVIARRVPASGRRILVVDDNRDSAESLATLLRLFGNDVRTVHDGQFAVEIAAAYGPDVVRLDIGLPGMDGLEVCRHLRAQPEGERFLIVAMTSYGREEDRRLSKEAGFNAYLIKPVDLDAITLGLKDILLTSIQTLRCNTNAREVNL
jgi:signal transduction histidine kinase/ActR/RegA family two-component response regulator